MRGGRLLLGYEKADRAGGTDACCPEIKVEKARVRE